MRAKGFDTSRHNHGDGSLLPIDFQAAVGGGYSFWCGRLSVGNYYTDPWIERDFSGAAPLVRLVYHVPRAGNDTPSQVANVLQSLALLDGTPAAIVLDMEGEQNSFSPQQITTCLGEHVSQLEAAIPGGKLILYTNFNYLENVLLSTFGLPIWISWPGPNGSMNPNDDPPLDAWILLQRSWTEAIPGVPDTTTDYDEFNGDEAAMQAYFGEELPPMPTLLENIQQARGLLADLRAQMLGTYQVLHPLLAEIERQVQGGEVPPPPPPPEPPHAHIQITKDPRANSFYETGQNAAGRPIMEIYPSDSAPTSERIQFALGVVLSVDPDKITADGGGKFWALLDYQGRAGEALYIREQDAAQVG